MKTGMRRASKNLLSWLLTLALVCSIGWPVTALSESATDSSVPTETIQEATAEPATPTPVPDTPTPVPETPSPVPETATPEPVTEAPATDTPTPEPTATPSPEVTATHTVTPTPGVTPTATPQPTTTPYTGYARLNARTNIYQNTTSSSYLFRLAKDSYVYVSDARLGGADRVYLNFAVDGEAVGGYADPTLLETLTTDQQSDLVADLLRADHPVYYQNDQHLPLAELTPEYPVAASPATPEVTATSEPTATPAPTETPVAKGASLSREQASNNMKDALWSAKTVQINCPSYLNMQSSHPYANNEDVVYVYRVSNAARIALTFSSDTYVEDNYDFIGIFNDKDVLINAYTGSELAGQTIVLRGNVFKVYLYTDSSVTKYGFRVTAVNNFIAPPAPASAYAASSTQVTVSWNASGMIHGYYLYRATNPNGPYTFVGATTGTSLPSAVPYGVMSYFKLRAYNDLSSATTGTTRYLSGYSAPFAFFALSAPSITSIVSAGSGSATISWRSVGNAQEYRVYRSDSENGTYSYVTTVYGTSATVAIDASVANYYKVCAACTREGVTYVGPRGAARYADIGVAQVVMGLAEVISSSQLKLNWNAVPGAAGYQIFRSASPDGEYTYRGVTGITTYTDNCMFGVINYYKVRAYKIINGQTVFGALSTYRSCFGLSTPTILDISVSGNSAAITLRTVMNATGYRVYRSTSQYGVYNLAATVSGSSATVFFNPSLDNYYRVQAIFNSGSVTYVGPLSTGRYAMPQVVMGLAEVISSSQLKLNWNPISGVAGYQIFRSTSPDGEYTYRGVTSTTSYTDNCVFGVINYYKVRAYRVIGGQTEYGSLSGYRSCFGLSTPTILNITAVGSAVTIDWQTVMNATGYYVYRSSTATGAYVRLDGISGSSYTDNSSDAGGYYMLRAYYVSDLGVTYVGPFSRAVQSPAVARTYRALVIGQGYHNSPVSDLNGTLKDASGMSAMLRNLSTLNYSVTHRTDLTASGILSSISSAFSGATANDVSLFYYSGHGSNGGYLVGTDASSSGGLLSPTQLRSRLDTIPGTKIVIVDSCFSGGLIGRSAIMSKEAQEKASSEFVSDFVSAFAGSTSRSNLAAGGYYVMTACHSTETSAETSNYGFFTYPLCKGCGWNYVSNSACGKYADSNSDHAITLSELYGYTYSNALSYNSEQHAQVYPSGSSYVLFSY